MKNEIDSYFKPYSIFHAALEKAYYVHRKCRTLSRETQKEMPSHTVQIHSDSVADG